MSPHHHGAGRVPPPSRDREHHPSFSAALLDAIYHSLDGDGSTPPSPPRRAPATSVSPAGIRSPRRPHCGRHRPSITLSSPVSSSSRSPRSQKPPRPCRVRPDDPQPSLLVPAPAPAPWNGAEKKRSRRKKAKSAPFACLLNAMLCNRRSAKSCETMTTTRALPAVAAEPASARSILSSRASRRESAAGAGWFLTPGRRAVRFAPAVEVVVDREHGREAGTARLRDEGTSKAAAAQETTAAEAERRVEELLRVLGVAEERERAKESSESSSDLFELETLAALDVDADLPRTRSPATGLAPPRPRVLVDEMVV